MERSAILVWCDLLNRLDSVDCYDIEATHWLLRVQDRLMGSYFATVYDLMAAGF